MFFLELQKHRIECDKECDKSEGTSVAMNWEKRHNLIKIWILCCRKIYLLYSSQEDNYILNTPHNYPEKVGM